MAPRPRSESPALRACIVTGADGRLRKLIRMHRREKARLTQEEAALRAGISTIYWKRIEQGSVGAPVDTLARMLYAVEAEAAYLRGAGYEELALEVEERVKALEQGGSPFGDEAESHLWRTPGMSDRLRYALIAYLRTVRDVAGLSPEWQGNQTAL